jgi:RNA polymerase sigma-70 factor (ECF subfamily)
VNPLSDSARFESEMMAVLDRLYGAALRLAKCPADAEDLVSDTVAKAWDARASLDDPARFRGWIFRILMNTFLSESRKQGTISLDDFSADSEGFSLFERLHQPFLLWWSDPEQEFLRKVLREDLARALDALPDAYRVVVVLSDLEGLRYREIADMLGIPIGTVRSRLARGRSLLHQAVWQHAGASRADIVEPAAGGAR